MVSDLSNYRPNVGILLVNRQGFLWLGRRAGTRGPDNWQFPQGGIDEGEDPAAAALRELKEETGASSVSLLGRTHDWIAYDFPEGMTGSKAARGWRGQKQLWFAYRFEGPDTEFTLDHHDEIEFDAWEWVDPAVVLDRVVAFKRDAYARALAELAQPLEHNRF